MGLKYAACAFVRLGYLQTFKVTTQRRVRIVQRCSSCSKTRESLYKPVTMSQAVAVATPLSQERGTINLLAVGHPVVVVVGGKDPAISSSSSGTVVTAVASRVLTGMGLPGDVQVGVAKNGDHVVTFDPKVTEKDDFTLAVFFEGEHITGSPFFLRYVEPSALSYLRTERRCAVADAGKMINLIVPLETRGEVVDGSVDGPFGQCKAVVKHFSLDVDDAKESVSMCFEPKGLGAYTIDLRVSQEHVKGSPFLILTDFRCEEAGKCYVLPDDEHLFKKRLPFKGSGEGITFRVFTRTAVEISHGPGALNVLCFGPKKAAVRLTEAADGSGLEACEVIPSAPGDYTISMLWKGQHISDSPRALQFRRPRSKIAANGLDLDSRVFYLGVPYRFKLNCSGFGKGAPHISCEPSGACDIRITPVSAASDSTYKCELLPSLIGTHSLSVSFRGRDISGSPFQVTFRDSCNPTACRIVQGSNTYTTGGILGLKVSTEGAGAGTLEAMAEDADTHASLPITVKVVSAEVYQLELDPGESGGCRLSVTYSKHHIPGSPFRLHFSNPDKFVLKGEGLAGARVNMWNGFTLRVKDPPPGALGVKVETDDKSKLSAETTVIPVDTDKFEVKYFPTVPGPYIIKAKWGRFPIPGSPFRVDCTSAVFQLRGAPKRIEVGSKLNFEVFLVSGGPLERKDSLEISARNAKGKKLQGEATLVDWEEEQVYTCSITPRLTGSHMVSIKWNKLNITGSPFGVKVVAVARPENVRVYGPGVEPGEVGEDREFTIETGAAGGGLLAVKIRGPTKELKFSTRQDPHNKRTLHTKYCPTLPGHYCVEVQWAGKHVQGSPFDIDLLPPSPLPQAGGVKLIVTAEVHPEFMSARELGAGARGLSLSQESINLETHFEGETYLSLSQDSLDVALSQDSTLDSSSFRNRMGTSLSRASNTLRSSLSTPRSSFRNGRALSQGSNTLGSSVRRSVSLSQERHSGALSEGEARLGGGGERHDHICIYVEDRDSVCSNGPRKIYDAEVQFFRQPHLPTQDSLESLDSTTSSLYDIEQLNADMERLNADIEQLSVSKVSDGQVSIQLGSA